MTRSETRRFRTLTALEAEVKHGDKGSVMLELRWDGKAFLRMGLTAVMQMLRDVAESPSEELSGDEFDEQGMQMSRAYERVRRKYTGRAPQIKPGMKHWPMIVRAAKIADELKVDYDTFVEAITDTLSRNPDQEIRVPWPSQLVSEKAELWVGDYMAKGRGNPEAEGTRRARANAGVPLERDDELKAVRRRMKFGKHTRADVAYVKARHREIYGAPKEWVARYEATAVDARSRKEAADE